MIPPSRISYKAGHVLFIPSCWFLCVAVRVAELFPRWREQMEQGQERWTSVDMCSGLFGLIL